MVLWESPRQCSSWTLCEGFCWLLLLPVMLLIVARPVKLAAFPTSLSDCQTPTGWNCSGKSETPAPDLLAQQRKRAVSGTDQPTQVLLPSSSAPALPNRETTDLHPEENCSRPLRKGEGVLRGRCTGSAGKGTFASLHLN